VPTRRGGEEVGCGTGAAPVPSSAPASVTLGRSEWIRPGTDVSAARTSRVRTCVGCRVREAPDGLLRVVLESGVVIPDPKAVRSGRGAWLHLGCLEAAERRKAFTRALRAPAAPDLSVLREFVARMPAVHVSDEPQ
jgi:predicted RNA-binding protein YlxR (DUF448 family)